MQQSPITNGSGETPSPRPRIQQNTPLHQYFHSTIFVQKLCHFNTLILIFRFAAFCSSVAASIFILVNLRGLNSPRWYDFDAIRDGGPKYIFFQSSGRIRGRVEGSDSDSDISIFAFDPPRCHPYFGPLCAGRIFVF